MKIERTTDSPILLKLIPETPLDAFKNGVMARSFSNIDIEYRVKKDGTLVVNIDPSWKDFTEHGDTEGYVKV